MTLSETADRWREKRVDAACLRTYHDRAEARRAGSCGACRSGDCPTRLTADEIAEVERLVIEARRRATAQY